MLACQTAKGQVAQLGFLILLKLFQRLGRPLPVADAPPLVVEHVARVAGIRGVSLTLEEYDRSGTRRRHLLVIRDRLGVQPYGPAVRHAMIHALAEAASTKHELEDLINVGIEQLVRQRFELPAFDTLNRAARRVRATLTRALHKRVFDVLSEDEMARIDALFITDLTTLRTPWNELKADAGNPTLSHLRDLVARQHWLAAQTVGSSSLAEIPAVKVRHFADGAKTLDAVRMQALEPHKRATFAVALLATQAAHALDDLGEMLLELASVQQDERKLCPRAGPARLRLGRAQVSCSLRAVISADGGHSQSVIHERRDKNTREGRQPRVARRRPLGRPEPLVPECSHRDRERVLG